MWYGRAAFLQAASLPDYHYLSPAIMVAAGRGFALPQPPPGSAVEGFMAGRRSALAFEEAASVDTGAADRFHESARYLIYLIGWWWRLAGISWPALATIAGVLHALAVAGGYALLRQVTGRVAALAGGVWLCTSTLQLAYVPHVRDYSKGAFILASLPLVVALGAIGPDRRRVLAVAAAAGLVIGLGLGFKMDVAIMAPVALGAIVLGRGRWPWSDAAEKLAAAAVFTGALLLAAAPVLLRLGAGGSNAAHVVLLGYADGFEAPLGIVPSAYNLLPFYSDGYVAQVVNARHGDPAAWLDFPSAAYDRAGLAFWGDLVRQFPADVFARALGAALASLDLAFAQPAPSLFLAQPLPGHSTLDALYVWLSGYRGWGWLAGLGLLVVASARGWRHGVLATALVLIVGGYPSLQFEGRHFFHTQIVSVVALAVALSAAARTVGALAAAGRGTPARRAAARAYALGGTLGFGRGAVAVVLLAVAPLAALRAYQAQHLERALDQHLRQPRTAVRATAVREGRGWLLRWDVPPPTAPAVAVQRVDHYLVEFEDDGTGERLVMAIRYDAASAEWDHSRVLTLEPARGVNRLAFTALTIPGQSVLAGVELGEGARRRLTGIYRLASAGPAGLPLDLRLPADWRERDLFQRLAIEPAGRGVPRLLVACAGRAGCQGLVGDVERLERDVEAPAAASLASVHASAIAVTARGLAMDGVAESESSYLLEWPEVARDEAAVFAVRGRLAAGGIAVGLLERGAWRTQVAIRSPGEFAALVPLPPGGPYVPLMTNALPAGQRRTRFLVTRAGILAGDGGP